MSTWIAWAVIAGIFVLVGVFAFVRRRQLSERWSERSERWSESEPPAASPEDRRRGASLIPFWTFWQ